MSHKTTYSTDAGELVIEFDYQPREKATQTYPGCDESVDIISVWVDMEFCSDKAIERFKEACLEHMASLRERAECEATDARCEQ